MTNAKGILKTLSLGQLPTQDFDWLEEIALGNSFNEFYCKQYLDFFICQGGSKVKLLIGQEGSGKTYFLRLLLRAAIDRHYAVANISARDIHLQYFNSFYSSVVRSISIENLINRYSSIIIIKLGYDPSQIPPEKNFMEWVTGQGRVFEAVRREVRQEVEKLLHNKRIDVTFSTAIMHLCNMQLGVRQTDYEQKANIIQWIEGLPVPTNSLKQHNIFCKIDRFNARNMLRSVIEIIRLLGMSGLLVCIDNLEDIVAINPETRRSKYTRAARDDAYESLRELIDDIDNLERVMFVMAARQEVVEDNVKGLRSYDALWLRLQNEIIADKPNLFADMVFLDQVIKPDKANLIKLGNKLINVALRSFPKLRTQKLDLNHIADEILSTESPISPIKHLVQDVAGRLLELI